MEGLNLVEFAKQHPSLRRKIAVSSGLCAVLLAAEYYGLVSDACRWLRRYPKFLFLTAQDLA